MGSEVEFVHDWGICTCMSAFYASNWSILAILMVFLSELCLDTCHSLWWTPSEHTATTSSKTGFFLVLQNVRYCVFDMSLRVRHIWFCMTDWKIFTFLDRYCSSISSHLSQERSNQVFLNYFEKLQLSFFAYQEFAAPGKYEKLDQTHSYLMWSLINIIFWSSYCQQREIDKQNVCYAYSSIPWFFNSWL